MSSKCLIVFLLLLSVPFLLFANTVTIEEAFESAKENNKSYSLALERYQDSVELNSTLSSLIPSLSITASAGTGMNNDLSWKGLSLSVGASASLTLSPSTYTEKRSQQLENESSYLSFLSTEEQLKLSVVEAYLNLLLYQEAVKVSEAALNTAEDQYESILESYEYGSKSELDVLSAEDTLSKAELNHRSNLSSLSAAECTFTSLTSLNTESLILMDLEDFDYSPLEGAEVLLEEREGYVTSLLQKKNSIKSAELEKTATVNSLFLPTISLSASYSLNGNINSTSSLSDTKGLSVQVSASIPLDAFIPGSSKNSQLKSAENSISYAYTTYEITYEETVQKLQEYFNSLNELSKKIIEDLKGLERAKKKLEASTLAYESGNASYDTLESAADNLASSEYSLISDRASYILKLYEIALSLSLNIDELKTEVL